MTDNDGTEDFNLTDLNLAHNPQKRRFEAHYGGKLVSLAAYEDTSDTVRDFNHTVTIPTLGGHGIAGHLVAWALDQSIAEGYKIIPGCTFVKDFVDDNPKYQSALAKN